METVGDRRGFVPGTVLKGGTTNGENEAGKLTLEKVKNLDGNKNA